MVKTQQTSGQATGVSTELDPGPRLGAVIDVRTHQPVEQAAPVNRATAYITSCIVEVLANRAELPERAAFVGLTGYVEYPGIRFPTELNAEVRQFVGESLNMLLDARSAAEATVSADRHTIKLFVAADYGTARQWVDAYVPPTKQRRGQGVVEQEAIDALWRAMDKVIAGLSADYDARQKQLVSLSEEIRKKLAGALTGPLNDFLRSQAPETIETIEQKRTLAEAVSEGLAKLGLAIRCPKTDGPGSLMAMADDLHPRGRFLIMPKAGRKPDIVRTKLSDLLPVELTEAAMRREALKEWWKRDSRRQQRSEGESRGR